MPYLVKDVSVENTDDDDIALVTLTMTSGTEIMFLIGSMQADALSQELTSFAEGY